MNPKEFDAVAREVAFWMLYIGRPMSWRTSEGKIVRLTATVEDDDTTEEEEVV